MGDIKMDTMTRDTHYRDQLLRETERMYKTKTGSCVTLYRDDLDIIGPTTIELRAKSAGVYIRIAHSVNDKWSLERNAWELGKKIHTKVKSKLYVY